MRINAALFEQAVEQSAIVELGAEAADEFLRREVMALRADLFQHVGRAQRADFARQLQIPAMRQPGQQPGAVGIADSGRVFDLGWREDRDVDDLAVA